MLAATLTSIIVGSAIALAAGAYVSHLLEQGAAIVAHPLSREP